MKRKCVIEIDFRDSGSHQEDDFSKYLVPYPEHGFDSLADNVLCHFDWIIESGQRSLILSMNIKDTSFRGYAFIDDINEDFDESMSLYKIN